MKRMTLVDTCSGMTGGDRYVCLICESMTVTSAFARAPTCDCDPGEILRDLRRRVEKAEAKAEEWEEAANHMADERDRFITETVEAEAARDEAIEVVATMMTGFYDLFEFCKKNFTEVKMSGTAYRYPPLKKPFENAAAAIELWETYQKGIRG